MSDRPSIETTVMIGDETEPPEVDHDGGTPDNWPFYIKIGDGCSRVRVMLSYAQADALKESLSQVLLDYEVLRGVATPC